MMVVPAPTWTGATSAETLVGPLATPALMRAAQKSQATVLVLPATAKLAATTSTAAAIEPWFAKTWRPGEIELQS